VDTGLNTQDLAYNYRVGFFYGSSQTFKDYSDPATSVRLTATSVSGGIQLNWNYNTPWTNANRKHTVYRQINGVFEKIADVSVGPTVATATFSDFGTYKGIRLRTQDSYCYYVQTNGSYSNPLILEPLLNKSQVACASPKDDQPPCPPTLEIDIQDCQNYNDAAPIQNVLKWKKIVTGTVNGLNCVDDIEKYRLYYSPTDPGDYKLIAELPDLTFTHGDLQSFAGCYYVTAVDFAGNESDKSNIVCKDNCVRYDLPNVFSPNGDDKNDLFQPYPGYRFVESVKFKVVNRWGATVFSTEDININWNGSDLPAGTYFYSAEVKFTRVRLSEANQVLQGWIQLIR
jgi:gliding motility-associated-like protein